jgi:hypothetical protein
MFKYLILLISLPFIVNSQTPDTTKKHKVLIGINGSCNYSYRTLSKSATKGDALTNTVIGLRNAYEKFDIGYAFGLEFQYKFNKTFSLRTGLNYNMPTNQLLKILIILLTTHIYQSNRKIYINLILLIYQLN